MTESGLFTLKLFHQNDPFQPIDARTLGEGGELAIGRDASAAWVIPDPECEISRQHCVIALQDGRLTLRDTSSNGIFFGSRGEKLARDEPVALGLKDSFRLGKYTIVVDRSDPEAPDDVNFGFETVFAFPGAAIPADWTDTSASATPSPSSGSLLEAFCAGAKLDVSAFAGEDPAEVMHRLGAVYQQLVLGLGDLMSERNSVKNEYRMDRTTVAAAGNNPFKWAPTQRVALDLLRPRDSGFLSGPAALKASFEDLKKHLLCVRAGARAAIDAAVDTLSPARVEEQVKGQSFVLSSKAATAWKRYETLHAELRAKGLAEEQGPINSAFRAAYQRRLQELDDMGPAS